jgi:hypothetical protein
MAAVSVSFDGTIISGAESETDGGTWDLWGKTQSPTQETDFVFQNTYAISTKVSNTTGGVDFDDAAAIDYTTPQAVISKIMTSVPGVIDLTVAEGMSYQVGSSGADYYNYYLFGLYAGEYPLTSSWLIIVIDPNEIAWRDAVVGTPALASIDYYGLYITTNGAVKAENIIHDRLDHFNVGKGHTLTGGDGADADGVFQDFLDYDYGTQNNRMGVVIENVAELVVYGTLTIGSATATVFNDSNFIIVFPHARVGEGFFGIAIAMSNASQDIDFLAGTFKSLGNASTKLFFDTSLEINATTDVVTIPNHGLETGDYVLYSKEGGTDTTGLTDATYYFVRRIDDDTISFYAVGATVGRQNAFTDTTRLALTQATAPGENHSIIRDPDTRADHTVTGTTGVGVDWTDCSIDGARIITLTSKATITGGFILRTGNIVLSTATLDGVNISSPTTTEGDSLLDPLTTIDNIVDCVFTSNGHSHAMRVTSAAGSPYDCDGNLFNDFWEPAVNGWKFDASAIATNIITMNAAHGFTTGEAVYYNDQGNTPVGGLTDLAKYYARAVSTTTVTLHATKAAAVGNTSIIALTAGTGTHHLYSANAAIFNDSGSAITIDILNGGDTPSVRNGGAYETTVNNSVTLTVTCKNEAGLAIQGIRVRIEETDGTLIANGSTNASGVFTNSYNYVSDTNVNVIARLKGYKNNKASDTIRSTGLSVPFTMARDPAVNLP